MYFVVRMQKRGVMPVTFQKEIKIRVTLLNGDNFVDDLWTYTDLFYLVPFLKVGQIIERCF